MTVVKYRGYTLYHVVVNITYSELFCLIIGIMEHVCNVSIAISAKQSVKVRGPLRFRISMCLLFQAVPAKNEIVQ